MGAIKITLEELEKIFDLWYKEHGETPDDFGNHGESDTPAGETFLHYLEKVRGEDYGSDNEESTLEIQDIKNNDKV